MLQKRDLSIRQFIATLPSVKTFLSTVGRNSIKTQKIYHTSLVHFQEFLNQKEQNYSLETIVGAILRRKIDVYELIDRFISYEMIHSVRKISPQSINAFLIGIKSYLTYYDVDIIPSKFRRRVKVPKVYHDNELPIDASDIRKLLLACNNLRVKAYLMVLASGGMRATEALAIRLKDIDYSVNPAKIHIRKEYAKTRVSRDIYISDEAAQAVKDLINWKYRSKRYNPRKSSPDDLIFTLSGTMKSNIYDGPYVTMIKEFQKVSARAGLDERKDASKRRKITLHSFRRFVKTVLSDQTNQDYSEWFLGHSGSPYYTKKESEKRELYAKNCMKYLTFLDYGVLESTGKNIEAKLEDKDKQIQLLKEHYENELKGMRDDMDRRLDKIMSMVQKNPKLAQIKPQALLKKKM